MVQVCWGMNFFVENLNLSLKFAKVFDTLWRCVTIECPLYLTVATVNNIPDVHLSGVPSEFSDTPESSHANVRVKEREEMMGMLEYKAEDEPKLLKMVIIGRKDWIGWDSV